MRGIRIPVIHSTPEQIDAALARLELGPADVLLDLGCGDGRVLLAARRAGCRWVVGVEIDGALAGIAASRLRMEAYQWGAFVRAGAEDAARAGDVHVGDMGDVGRNGTRLRREVLRAAPTAVYGYCGQAHWARLMEIAASLPSVKHVEIGAMRT